MSDLRDLYQELILDHCRKPRNYSAMKDCDCSAEGVNPLCGDRIKVFLKLDGEILSDARFQGTGCAICMASASLMTDGIQGRSRSEVELLFEQFHNMVTSDVKGTEGSSAPDQDASAKFHEDDEHLSKLAVFAGVREYPIRVKCATLAWHTLKAALMNDDHAVSTE